jgi:hypothetical protein
VADYPLGPVGLWTGLFEGLRHGELTETAARIEEQGGRAAAGRGAGDGLTTAT